jgi:hypothetical protein
MDEAKWERWGALAGVVFVVLVVVAAFIAGSAPKPTDSAAKIVKYFKDNQDSLRVGSYLGGLSLVPFLWFLGTLFGRLRRAEGGAGRVSGIALTGGVVTGAIALVAYGIDAYAALHPDASVGFFQFSTILFGYVGFAIAVLVAATSIVVLRSKLLPSWFGWAGAALAAVWLVGAGAVSTENDTVGTVGFIALLAWALWIIGLGVMFYRSPQAATS